MLGRLTVNSKLLTLKDGGCDINAVHYRPQDKESLKPLFFLSVSIPLNGNGCIDHLNNYIVLTVSFYIVGVHGRQNIL